MQSVDLYLGSNSTMWVELFNNQTFEKSKAHFQVSFYGDLSVLILFNGTEIKNKTSTYSEFKAGFRIPIPPNKGWNYIFMANTGNKEERITLMYSEATRLKLLVSLIAYSIILIY